MHRRNIRVIPIYGVAANHNSRPGLDGSGNGSGRLNDCSIPGITLETRDVFHSKSSVGNLSKFPSNRRDILSMLVNLARCARFIPAQRNSFLSSDLCQRIFVKGIRTETEDNPPGERWTRKMLFRIYRFLLGHCVGGTPEEEPGSARWKRG